jgi:glycerate-2-kinase
MSNDPKRYCAIVFIGGGSSWVYGPKVEGLAVKAGKQAKADWKSLFQMKKKQEFNVVLIDTLGFDGWIAHSGKILGTTRDSEPVELQPLKVETVTV